MEPAIIEMNVPVAIAVIIGMIGWFSWQVSKNFENYLRVNPTMAGDGLVGVEDFSAEAEESAEEEMDVEEEAVAEDAVEAAVAEQEDAGAVGEVVAEDMSHVDEVLDVEMDTNDRAQAQTDIDTFHARIEEIDNKLEVTRSLVTELCKTVIDTNDSTKNYFNKTFDTLETKVAASLSRIEASTSGSLSTFRNSLDNYAKSLQAVTDVLSSVQISLGDFVSSRDFNNLKTQMEELLKRSTIRKSVYQAWNGSSKWTDFNEGELNIQMIRKKFMTNEQNEEWLLPENKKIAAYNRDQLLGLNEDTWTTKDNTVFVKRYYKDDWDSSIEVAITVTLSKKILVPPGGKPETIISHILKKLYEKDQIIWEHLLVNV